MNYPAERLEFGNLEHILFVRQTELRSLQGERETLWQSLSRLRKYDEHDEKFFVVSERYGKEHAQILREVAEVDAKIEAVGAALNAARAEMRFVRERKYALTDAQTSC